MSDEPSFEIAHPPERRYSRHAGFEYAGGTVFSLSPVTGTANPPLDGLLTDVLSEEPYTYGDWFDLPMTLYLVYDAHTGDVFRVAIRDGAIELHALPSTKPSGLRRLYGRLCAVSGIEWRVERSATGD